MVMELRNGYDGIFLARESGTCSKEPSISHYCRPFGNTPPTTHANNDRSPKVPDQLREALRARQYRPQTEGTYCQWVKRFISFPDVRHPAEMADPEINAFLTHLAVKHKVSTLTQSQALSGLLFLYRHVIGREIGDQGMLSMLMHPLGGACNGFPPGKSMEKTPKQGRRGRIISMKPCSSEP